MERTARMWIDTAGPVKKDRPSFAVRLGVRSLAGHAALAGSTTPGYLVMRVWRPQTSKGDTITRSPCGHVLQMRTSSIPEDTKSNYGPGMVPGTPITNWAATYGQMGPTGHHKCI